MWCVELRELGLPGHLLIRPQTGTPIRRTPLAHKRFSPRFFCAAPAPAPALPPTAAFFAGKALPLLLPRTELAPRTPCGYAPPAAKVPAELEADAEFDETGAGRFFGMTLDELDEAEPERDGFIASDTARGIDAASCMFSSRLAYDKVPVPCVEVAGVDLVAARVLGPDEVEVDAEEAGAAAG